MLKELEFPFDNDEIMRSKRKSAAGSKGTRKRNSAENRGFGRVYHLGYCKGDRAVFAR